MICLFQQNYFSDYLKEFRRVLVNIKEKCRGESTSVDSDDWSLFQNSLRIIQTCGEYQPGIQRNTIVLTRNVPQLANTTRVAYVCDF